MKTACLALVALALWLPSLVISTSASADDGYCKQYNPTFADQDREPGPRGDRIGCAVDPCCYPIKLGHRFTPGGRKIARWGCHFEGQKNFCQKLEARRLKHKKKKIKCDETCDKDADEGLIDSGEIEDLAEQAATKADDDKQAEEAKKEVAREIAELEESVKHFDTEVARPRKDEGVGIYLERGDTMVLKPCESPRSDEPCFTFAVKEASELIDSLDPKQKFNVFFTSNGFKAWREHPVEASNTNKLSAKAFAADWKKKIWVQSGDARIDKALMKTVAENGIDVAVIFGSGDTYMWRGAPRNRRRIKNLHKERSEDGKDFRIIFRPYARESEWEDLFNGVDGTNWEFLESITAGPGDVLLTQGGKKAKLEQIQKRIKELKLQQENAAKKTTVPEP